MLSHAVMPPNYEHVYAQWREKDTCGQAGDDAPQLTGSHVDIKMGEEADLPTSLAHNTSRSCYMDMREIRLRLKGNSTLAV